MDKIKVVLDVNVFISGLLWEGIPHKILKLSEKGYLTLTLLRHLNFFHIIYCVIILSLIQHIVLYLISYVVGLITTFSIIDETAEVLSRPKFSARISSINTSVTELIESLLNLVELIVPSDIAPVIIVDPDDDKILACAFSSKAVYIVSGDSHLLDLKEYENIQIKSPGDFWEKVKILVHNERNYENCKSSQRRRRPARRSLSASGGCRTGRHFGRRV